MMQRSGTTSLSGGESARRAVLEEAPVPFPGSAPRLHLSTEAEMAAKASGRSAVSGTTDMTKVEPFLQEAASQITEYEAKASMAKVTTIEEAENAGRLAREMAEKVESMERQRREFVDPLNKHVKLINQRFKAVTEPLSRIVMTVKQKIESYYTEQKRIADEKARRLEVENSLNSVTDVAELEQRFGFWARRKKSGEKLGEWEEKMLARYMERLKELKAYEKKVEKAQEKGKAAPPPPPAAPPQAPVIPAIPQKTMGTTTVREIWTFEVKDISAVPVEYLLVDSPKVRAYISECNRRKVTPEVPGLHIFKKASAAV